MSTNEGTSKPERGEPHSANSETSKNKSKIRGKKRKRQDSDSSDYEDVLPDNLLEMEKNLHASAIKNNLDPDSVRKILKKVVTNDHVLALVKLQEEEEGSGPEENSLRPKLTRSKVKELMKVSPKSTAWNLELTPIKHIPVKTRPEVKALIAQELPEDEDDEEYEPTNDDVPSDDDLTGLESCSDLESQPRTPATPHNQIISPTKVVQDGPFKVPVDVSTPARRKLDLEEKATIALRTRSKLSLSATSIEHIESTFVPPDDIPMPAVDDLWNQFLNECLNPASVTRHEDDDEADPEYNVAADPDAQDEDEEALGNSLIKISKKELNDLVTELFNIIPDQELPTDELLSNSVLTDQSHAEISTRWEGKQEPLSDDETTVRLSDRITFEKKNYTRMSIGKTEPHDVDEQTEEPVATGLVKILPKGQEQRKTDSSKKKNLGKKSDTVGEAPPLLQPRLRAPPAETLTIQIQEPVQMLPEQIVILQQQLRQHVQLATQHFLQIYVHPIHWKYAPHFKEYLESLNKLAVANPKSVVNVCNLAPALELMHSWESTVSQDTPENMAMIEFMEKEIDKNRRSLVMKTTIQGDFPDTFKEVISNSTVFLYPYLLPPMPFKPDPIRRCTYHVSEDRLIVLGLDQFWQYVEDNPELYKRPHKTHPRHRWGLTTTIQLVCKHMFPWITNKILLAHIQHMRKIGVADNPIKKFFATREIEPVKHKLIPFNPKLTLYEQPEHEVPRIWLRYLAKTSKRFKKFLYHRQHELVLNPSGGVDITIGQKIQEPSKTPLPIDFNKPILSTRLNLLPKPPSVCDKYDLQIEGNTPNVPQMQANVILQNGTNSTEFVYNLVETSNGAFLMPAPCNTISVASNTAPISSTEVSSNNITPTVVTENHNSQVQNRSQSIEKLVKPGHCTCCVLLRKIRKTRQTSILEYYGKKHRNVCPCKNQKYPKVSNRLRLLVRNYKSNYTCNLEMLKANLKVNKNGEYVEDGLGRLEYSQEDVDYVNLFHVRLLTRLSIYRDTRVKTKVNTILSRYNPHKHCPIVLMRNLYEACGIDLIDLYKEFLGLLTPKQADEMDVFRDNFLRNGVFEVVKKVEDQVQNANHKRNILQKLHGVFYTTLASACEICTELLSALEAYPDLATSVFYMFPHTTVTKKPPLASQNPSKPEQNQSSEPVKESGATTTEISLQSASKENEVKTVTEMDDSGNQDGCLQVDESALDDDTHTAMDYEADHSCSDEDNLPISSFKKNDNCEKNPIEIKVEQPTENEPSISENFYPIITVSKIEVLECAEHPNSPEETFEENPVKEEVPEWKRDEDKTILQMLKEHLTPEQRQDKTILEIIEEKCIIELIGQSLVQKSLDDIRKRVLYLLELLVVSENNQKS